MFISGQQGIADLFGVSRETIDNWQKEGMPVAARGGPGIPNQYDASRCVAWRIKSELEKIKDTNPQARLASVRADTLELDIAAMRQTLIPIAKVQPLFAAFLELAVDKWDSRKGILAERLAEMPAGEIEPYLVAEFEAYLLELSRVQPSVLYRVEKIDE